MSRHILNSNCSFGHRTFLAITIVALLSTGLSAAGVPNADVAGHWDVVANQAVVFAGKIESPTPAGASAMFGCIFEGTLDLSQTGGVISGTILLTNNGEGTLTEECAESIQSNVSGSVMGNDIHFTVTPGFVYGMAMSASLTLDDKTRNLAFSGLNFDGTVSDSSMSGTWGFNAMSESVSPSGPGTAVLGPFTAARVPEPVPTLSHFGLVLLMGLLGAAGVFLFGRGGLS